MVTVEGGVLSGQDLLATPLSQFFVQAIIVILLTRTLAVLLHYVGQPRVIAEVIGGIILGPSVFGRHIPGYSARVFPQASLGQLGLVANIGLVLYLFLVGIEMDPGTMVKNARKTCLVAISGVGLPFALGFAISPFLYEQLIAPEPGYGNVSQRSFSVFVCVAISITAFPVLARILNETNLLKTVVGNTAMGAAALDDVTAWSLLALSIAMIHAGNPSTAAFIFLSVVAYALGVLGLLRPVWSKLVDFIYHSGSHALRMSLMAMTFLLVFFSAWVTEILGVHAIFGAFLFGLAMPRGHAFTLEVSEKIEDIVQIVFLPLYFTLSGLKTDISEIHNARDGGILAIVLITAIAAKFIGCTFGAKLTGLSLRESATVGILMNTRGLVELIVLNVGLEAKVISPKLFTIMVMMAIITTVMTTPLVQLVYPIRHRKYIEEERFETDAITAKRRNVKRGPNDVELQMVVYNLDEIPAMASLIHLLKPDKEGIQRITASSLIEASIATTDIVRATQADALKPDLPALQMLQAVGLLVGAEVDTEEIVGNPRTFAEVLSRKGQERAVDMALVPYCLTLHFVTDSYDRFLHDFINSAKSPVVLLVPGGKVTHSIVTQGKHDILAVITGEENDIELLGVAKRFSRWADVQVSLLLLQKDDTTPWDPRLDQCIQDFKASIPDNTTPRVINTSSLVGTDITQENVINEAQSKAYDFILVSHGRNDDLFHVEPAATLSSRGPSMSGHRKSVGMSGEYGARKSSAHGGATSLASGDYGAVFGGESGHISATPGKSDRLGGSSAGKKLPGLQVLGTVGAQLMAGNVGASLLVMHGVHSSVQLTRGAGLSLGRPSEDKGLGIEMRRLAQKIEEYYSHTDHTVSGGKESADEAAASAGGDDTRV